MITPGCMRNPPWFNGVDRRWVAPSVDQDDVGVEGGLHGETAPLEAEPPSNSECNEGPGRVEDPDTWRRFPRELGHDPAAIQIPARTHERYRARVDPEPR